MPNRRLFIILVAFLSMMLISTLSWAASITGSITNSSGKNGWITINLSNQYGSSGLGTAVNLTSGTSTSYTIVGVPDGSYTLEAYLDMTSTGMRHANDPATTASVTISNNQNTTQNLTLGLPGTASLAAPPALYIIPGSQGAFVQVDTENQRDANGRLIAESYLLSCNSGSVTVSIASNDNSFALLSGLTDGTTLSCTVTPIVKGVADTGQQASNSTPIGDCNFTNSCSGTTHLSGKVAFGNGVSYTGKTLYVAAVPPTGGQPYVAAASNLQTNPATVDIYGIPAGTYKIYTILDGNGSNTIGPGDLQVQDTSAPIVIVNGLDATITIPTVTLYNLNSYLEFGVHHGKNSAPNDMDYNFTMQLSDGLKRPVKLTIKDTNTPQASVLFTIGRDNYGSGFWSYGQNMPRPVIGATVGYADITYDNNDVDSNIPLTVKTILDEFPPVIFPSGNVRLPNNSIPQASWRTPGPLPGYYFNYRAWMSNCNTNGDNPNDFLLSSTLSTTFNGCTQLQNGSPSSWNMLLRDQFGNMTEQYTSFTPQAGGPVISGFTPPSGGTSQAIAVTGSGFTGASSVSINGTTVPFTANSDTSITINAPSSLNSGPILVTTGGITGASSDSYTGLVQVGGTVSDKASVRIPGAIVKVVGSNPAVSATAGSPNGDYVLGSVPAGMPFVLQITAANYLPTYSRIFSTNGNNTTAYTWNLYTAADVAGWGVTPGKGVIRTRVSENQSGGATPSVGDATVSATSWLHPDTPYVVKYADVATGAPSNTATATPNSGSYMGIFYVMDIDEGDIVTVNAHKTDYAFQANAYQVHGGSVSQSRIFGAKMPTSLTAVTSATPNGNGSYNNTISVSFAWTPNNDATINANTSTILYTTDGRDPRFYGTSYPVTNPSMPPTFNLSSTTTVKYVYRNYASVFGTVGSTTFVIQQPPTINGLRSNSGNSGEMLTLDGMFPDTNNANYQVLFNGVTPATNLSVNMSSSLTFTVPAGSFTYFTVNYFGQALYTGNLLSVTISGNGTVNDNGAQPTGFYCATVTCQRYFDTTASLNLAPTPSNGSVFQGWTPSCAGGSGPNGCAISMSTPVSKTATFVLATPKTFKIFNTNVEDDVLQNVYEQVFTNTYPPGTVLQGLAGSGPYSQNFTANRNVDVIIKGGFDNGFSSNVDTFTTIHPLTPPLIIQNGRVVFEGIKVN